jgi:hypothetical protein
MEGVAEIESKDEKRDAIRYGIRESAGSTGFLP